MLLDIMSNMRNKICMPFRYKVLLKEIKSFDNKKMLDVGCGDYSPYYTQTIFPKADYWGIDINGKFSTFFKEKHKFLKVNVENEPLPFKESTFDIVVVSHVLEHLRNVHGVIKECYRILKPGGLIYTEAPSPISIILPSMDGTLNFYDDMSHIRPFTKTSLKKLLSSHNFKVIKCRTRRDWLWIIFGIPSVIFKNITRNMPLYGGYFWDLFGCVVFVIGKK